MTRRRLFSTYAFALTIVVAQLLCGCMASIGSPSFAAVDTNSVADTPMVRPPCHGAAAEQSLPEDQPDTSHDCTHCATSAAMVADSVSVATPDVLKLEHWAPALAAVNDFASTATTTVDLRPPGWRIPQPVQTLVSQHILLLI